METLTLSNAVHEKSVIVMLQQYRRPHRNPQQGCIDRSTLQECMERCDSKTQWLQGRIAFHQFSSIFQRLASRLEVEPILTSTRYCLEKICISLTLLAMQPLKNCNTNTKFSKANQHYPFNIKLQRNGETGTCISISAQLKCTRYTCITPEAIDTAPLHPFHQPDLFPMFSCTPTPPPPSTTQDTNDSTVKNSAATAYKTSTSAIDKMPVLPPCFPYISYIDPSRGRFFSLSSPPPFG